MAHSNQARHPMSAISLFAAATLTGLSKRTLWRRIGDGTLAAVAPAAGGGQTRVRLDELLPHAVIPLETADRALVLAADGGAAEAQCELGIRLLAAGRPAPAAAWFALAAKQFYPDAMCFLGRGHLSGAGVARDEAAGLMWLSHAAAKGHPLALGLMAFLHGPAGQRLLAAGEAAALDAALDDIERRILLGALAAAVDPA